MSNIFYTHSKKCMDIAAKWSIPNVDTPHLLITQPLYGGVGCTEYVENLAKIHYVKIGVRRSFNKCFLHLRFPYDMSERDIHRFLNSPRVVAEQYNKFLGTFCIDLSEHLSSIEEPEFRMLIRFIEENQRDIMFIFIVSSDDEKLMAQLYRLLSKILRIERLSMEYTDTAAYVEYALSLLKNKEMPIKRGVAQVLTEYIEEISQKKQFSGYDTVLRLIDDIIYETRSVNKNNLTAKYLTEIKGEILPEDIEENSFGKIGFR